MNYKSFTIVVDSSISIADLGNISFNAGTYDLGNYFPTEDIVNSADLAELIFNGSITSATDHLGQTVTAGVSAQATFTALNKLARVSQDLVESYIDGHLQVGASSSNFLTINNGVIDVTKLSITDVTVDSTYNDIATWAAAEYTTSQDFQEGDVLIMTAYTGGTRTFIHNGGTNLDATDFTVIDVPNLTDAYIRGLFSAEVNGPLNYNVLTGEFDLVVDNVTLATNSAGELYVVEGALTIGVSQITNFGTEVESAIFTAANFADSSTIDFTVTAGDSVTASIIDASIGEDKLNVTNTPISGYYLTYGGSNNFTWVPAAAALIEGEFINIASDNSINVKYDGTTIVDDGLGQLSVDTNALGIYVNVAADQGIGDGLYHGETITFVGGDAITTTVASGTLLTIDVAYDPTTLAINTAGQLEVISDGIVTASNGLTKSGTNIVLGGELTATTSIGGSGTYVLNVGTIGSKLGSFFSRTLDTFFAQASDGIGYFANINASSASSYISYNNGTSTSSFTSDATQAVATYDSGLGPVATSTLDGSVARLQYATLDYTNNVEVTGTQLVLTVNDTVNVDSNTITLDKNRTVFDKGITIGDITATASAGDIKYVGGDFFGYNGSTWVSFTAGSGLIAGTAIEIATDNSINALYDNDTIKVNGSNQLYVDETSLTITASQVSDFTTAAETAIFTTGNFTDSSRIDFTVTAGDSVTADLVAGSITEGYLAINSPSTGATGDVLTSDGAGNFDWTPASTFNKRSWTWGAGSNSNNNTNRYADRHDGISTNVAGYVVWSACKLVAFSLKQNGTVTYTAEVRKNGTPVATLSSGGNSTAYTSGLNVSFAAGDIVSFYINGNNVPINTMDALFVAA